MPDFLSDADWQKFNKMWEGYVLQARRTSWPMEGYSEQHERHDDGTGVRGNFIAPISGWPLTAGGL